MYRYWFDNIKGLTPVKKRILYETFLKRKSFIMHRKIRSGK